MGYYHMGYYHWYYHIKSIYHTWSIWVITMDFTHEQTPLEAMAE